MEKKCLEKKKRIEEANRINNPPLSKYGLFDLCKLGKLPQLRKFYFKWEKTNPYSAFFELGVGIDVACQNKHFDCADLLLEIW